MTKSPIAEARELLKSGRITELMDMVALLRIIEYAESLERKVKRLEKRDIEVGEEIVQGWKAGD